MHRERIMECRTCGKPFMVSGGRTGPMIDYEDQARLTFRYIVGLLRSVPALGPQREPRQFPPDIAAAFPYRMATDGRLTRVSGVQAAQHLERLRYARTTFLTVFRTMSLGDWDRLRAPRDVDYHVTPAWAVFHLLEHESGHASQISALKARAGSGR